LCSRIPFYRLPLVLRDHPDLDGIGRLTLLQSLGCVRLVLWDEDRQRLVSFREARPKGKRGPEREAHLISMVESWLQSRGSSRPDPSRHGSFEADHSPKSKLGQ
jgi:hypothetical protein